MSFVMDFTANGGLGSGSLFFNDLTTSGSMILLGSLANLGNPMSQESFWNTMWSRSDNGPFAADSHVVLDNLTITPTFAPVPELNGAWAIGACGVLLCGHFICRRRRFGA